MISAPERAGHRYSVDKADPETVAGRHPDGPSNSTVLPGVQAVIARRDALPVTTDPSAGSSPDCSANFDTMGCVATGTPTARPNTVSAVDRGCPHRPAGEARTIGSPGRARGTVVRLGHTGAADHCIRQQLLGISPVERTASSSRRRWWRPTNTVDTNPDDCRGQKLPAVPPHIPTHLAQQDAVHHSRSCASTGAATRS